MALVSSQSTLFTLNVFSFSLPNWALCCLLHPMLSPFKKKNTTLSSTVWLLWKLPQPCDQSRQLMSCSIVSLSSSTGLLGAHSDTHRKSQRCRSFAAPSGQLSSAHSVPPSSTPCRGCLPALQSDIPWTSGCSVAGSKLMLHAEIGIKHPTAQVSIT